MNRKVRVNITVDQATLDKAKKKLHLFGGKLSTLFNAYLEDFVSSMNKDIDKETTLIEKIKDLESRLEKLERGEEKRKAHK